MSNAPYPYEGGESREKPPSNGKAVASLICGIFSIIFPFNGLALLGMIFPIPGIILAIFAMKESTSGIAVIGLICSIIGFILYIILFTILIACINFFPEFTRMG